MLVVRFPSGLCLRSFVYIFHLRICNIFSHAASRHCLLDLFCLLFATPRFRFFFSLLLCTFVLLCSLVAAFVFVLCLSHALVAVVFWCCNSRLSFCSMVFTIIHSQLGYVSGEGDKKKRWGRGEMQERSRAWITWINGGRIVEKESKEEERWKERSNMK